MDSLNTQPKIELKFRPKYQSKLERIGRIGILCSFGLATVLVIAMLSLAI